MKDNAISLEEFWSLVMRLNEDVTRCMFALYETPEDDEEGRAFWRRVYARSVFAMIDGATYRMMFHAYAASGRPGVAFSVDELARLEQAYDFNEDREPIATFSKTQMLDDIRFAFEAFARVHLAAYVLPGHDANWVLIKQMAEIRQGLQFCRAAQEIEVREEDVETLLAGREFFVECLVGLLESSADSMEAGACAGELIDHEVIM